MIIRYYYFIDEFNKNEIEKLPTKISLIYRNYNKKSDPLELKKLVIHCKNNRRKVYISNSLKDAVKYSFDGLYVPSFYKQLRFKNMFKKLEGDIEWKTAQVLFTYRNLVHGTTGKTPAELFLGRSPRTRLSLTKPNLKTRVEGRQMNMKEHF